MPIDRPGGTSAEAVMEEGAQAPQAQGPGEDQSQTAELPISMFAGKSVKEGDVFEFKVVAVDQEGGSVTVVYNTGDSESKDGYGGSDEMGAAFDKPITKGQI